MKSHNKSGFTFIEIIIALGLAAIIIPALAGVLSFSIRVTSQGEKFTQANALAREGMEAIYYIKSNDPTNWDWTSTPTNTSPGQYYQPKKSGNIWILGSITSNPSITNAPFTRTVTIEVVRRCGTAPDLYICTDPLAAVDNYTREITTVVSWLEVGGPQKVSLESYVTAH